MGSLRFLTAGESHGPELTGILDGVPAGFSICTEAINHDLKRRQTGFGKSARMKLEKDEVQILSGLFENKTTGAPIAFRLNNQDHANWAHRPIPVVTIPRPGHADLCGSLKYGHHNLQMTIERASARETAMRVCVGALCKQLLAPFGIQVGGYVVSIGQVASRQPIVDDLMGLKNRIEQALGNEMAFADLSCVEPAKEHIRATMKQKDTLGGVVEVVALGLPVGLGSYAQWDRRLDAQIGHALLSIPAVKGVEFGQAFSNSQQPGSLVHDAIGMKPEGAFYRHTNHAGGLEGGITNGEPLVVRIAMKPINTVLKSLPSINLQTGQPCQTEYVRSDFCAVPRLVPIAEAMLAFTLTIALFHKLGGDSLNELQKAFGSLRSNHLACHPTYGLGVPPCIP